MQVHSIVTLLYMWVINELLSFVTQSAYWYLLVLTAYCLSFCDID